MKLKTRVATLDDVPQEYRDRYVQDAESKSYILEELEIEDVSGLKKNHEKLLKSHGSTQDELRKLKETWGDLNPQTAREALKKLEELENKSLMDEGKFEELHAKRTEALKKDHENQIKALTASIEEAKKRSATLESQLQRMTIANDLSNHAGKLRIKPGMVPFLQLAAKEAWSLDEDGNPVWKIDGQVKYGKDGTKPATMEEYLQELISSTPDLLEGSNGNGSNGNTARGAGPLTISRNATQEQYAAVKEAAAKQGKSLSDVQVVD